MSEEAKIKYEKPKMISFFGIMKGLGDCINGSGDTTVCNIGTAAIDNCVGGSNIIVF